MKYNYDIKEINKVNKFIAVEFIQKYHYSKVLPKITKYYLGSYLDNELVGVLTLGWGTQPLQTIKKIIPSSTTKDYLEIGKMCMHPNMPRNSESQLLSSVIQWIKNNLPDIKFLYTWADGIVGKPGYVYQSANFLYGGYIWTDVYIGTDGEKIHPRSTKNILKENAKFVGKDKLFWMTPDFMKWKGIRRIRGKQFRYIMPLNKRAKRKLLKESTIEWNINYPKHKDLEWKEQINKGEYVKLDEMPEFDLEIENVNYKNINSSGVKVISNFFDI